MPIIYIHYDSQFVIGKAQSNMYNDKSKLIYHINNILKQFLSNDIILINYVKSKEKIMNLLTKGLLREFVNNSSKKICLKTFKIKEFNDSNPT